jgi:hypothetical protein
VTVDSDGPLIRRSDGSVQRHVIAIRLFPNPNFLSGIDSTTLPPGLFHSQRTYPFCYHPHSPQTPTSNPSLDISLSYQYYSIDTPDQTPSLARRMAPDNEESYVLYGEYLLPHRIRAYLIL